MKIKLICNYCGSEFLREKREVNRQNKKGKKSYCSISCSSKSYIKEKGTNNLGDYLCKIPRIGSESDELSKFRIHIRLARSRSKKLNIPFEIDAADLKQVWEQQQGLCPYTGWSLINCENSCPINQMAKTMDRASLDRIDSDKGYVRDNVEFVSLAAQYAKNVWSKEEMLKFCEAVSCKFHSYITS